MRRGLIQNFSSIAVIFQVLIADPVFAEVGASAPTVFSLTVRGGLGAAIKNRSALFKNQSQDYQGLAQPVAKSMVNLSIQPILTGLEGSYSWGKVKLVDLDGASAGVDTFTRFVPSIYMGLKL